jgi:hypothetical protein
LIHNLLSQHTMRVGEVNMGRRKGKGSSGREGGRETRLSSPKGGEGRRRERRGGRGRGRERRTRRRGER